VRNPNSVANADPERISHNGKCEWCGVEAVVPMVRTRIERRPWRLVWWCDVCGRQSRARVPVELVDVFVSWDRAGGTTLSMREVVEMVQVDLDELNAAIEDELL
jgi:transcription elongation factor Elf1